MPNQYHEGNVVAVIQPYSVYEYTKMYHRLGLDDAYHYNKYFRPEFGSAAVVVHDGVRHGTRPDEVVVACVGTTSHELFFINAEGLVLSDDFINTKENTTMSKTVTVEHQTLINGRNLKGMTFDDLVATIKAGKEAIQDLKDLGSDSVVVGDRIAEMEANLAEAVRLLDAKLTKKAPALDLGAE